MKPIKMNDRGLFYLALFCFLIIFFNACSKQDVAEISENGIESMPVYLNVDERLWTYFESFESEANARGFVLDLNELKIVGAIQNIDEQGVAGYCEYGSHINNEIIIDNQFWSRANSVSREFVVYHELGHCVLLRDHEEFSNLDGTCRSIMRSGLGNCRDNYSESTRVEYLDELFSNHNL